MTISFGIYVKYSSQSQVDSQFKKKNKKQQQKNLVKTSG